MGLRQRGDSTDDLSASVWRWHREDDSWRADKVITIPAEPADPDDLPPALQPFGAVPPLVTDIDLSVDDQLLYVSCWGTGELKQYDVSDPAHPREAGSVRLGGIVRPRRASPRRRASRWPAARRWWRSAATAARVPDELAVRRVGRPVLPGRRRRLDGQDRHRPRGRRAQLDERFFPHGADFRGLRVHQMRLQGGDASSDSYCYR